MMDVEFEAYEDAGDSDATRKIDGILEMITARVRGKVSSCKDVTSMGEAGTIPEELLDAAAVLCKYRLALVVPGLDEEQDAMRKEEYKDAIKQLNEAAACDISIAPPGGATQPAPNPSAYGGDPLLKF